MAAMPTPEVARGQLRPVDPTRVGGRVLDRRDGVLDWNRTALSGGVFLVVSGFRWGFGNLFGSRGPRPM